MKALSAILLLGVAAGCSSTKAGPGKTDPYRDVGAFCGQWGKAACNKVVVSNCSAASASACVASQKKFCLGLIPPSGYSSRFAKQCITAVHNAYADARITADEYKVVTSLGAPCDQLVKGPGAEGAGCTGDGGCNTLDGLHCVLRPGDSTGTCYKPDVVGGGFSCDKPQQTCDTGFYCDGSNCLARKAVGKACSPTEPCVETAQCKGQICEAKGATSDPCQLDGDCQSNICAVAAGAQNGVCVDKIILGPTEPLCLELR